jgi:hypothetical protein
MRLVTSSLRADGSRSSDQQEVWSRIAKKSARLGAVSDTSAMSAMFDACHVALDEFVAAFTPIERQVGAVFFVNDRAAGLELFDARRTWRTLAPKLIRSYALDALDQGGQSGSVERCRGSDGVDPRPDVKSGIGLPGRW